MGRNTSYKARWNSAVQLVTDYTQSVSDHRLIAAEVNRKYQCAWRDLVRGSSTAVLGLKDIINDCWTPPDEAKTAKGVNIALRKSNDLAECASALADSIEVLTMTVKRQQEMIDALVGALAEEHSVLEADTAAMRHTLALQFDVDKDSEIESISAAAEPVVADADQSRHNVVAQASSSSNKVSNRLSAVLIDRKNITRAESVRSEHTE
jgi:hypothetical protein